MPAKKRIGELLVEAKALTPERLEEALAVERQPGQRLGELLVERGWVAEALVTQALSMQLAVPWVSLTHVEVAKPLLDKVPRELAEKHCVFPIFVRNVRGQGDALYLAMADPLDSVARSDVSKQAGLPTRPMIASSSDIRSAIRLYYGGVPDQPTEEPRKPPPPPPRKPPIPAAQPQAGTNGAPNGGASAPSAAGPVSSAVASAPQAAAATSTPSITNATPGTGVPTATPPTGAPAMTPPTGSPSAGAMKVPSVPKIPALLPPLQRGGTPADGSPRAASPSQQDVEEAARNGAPPARSSARRISLTLLDGTEIPIPNRNRADASSPSLEQQAAADGLTVKDLLSALRARAHGVDASELLGDKSARWETMMAALLTILVRRGLVGEAELLEELRKI